VETVVRPHQHVYDEMLGQLRNRECNEDVVDMIRQVPILNSCRSSLHRNRAKQLPKLPVTQNDINLDGSWSESSGFKTKSLSSIVSFSSVNNRVCVL
jgi:hypothetical protein